MIMSGAVNPKDWKFYQYVLLDWGGNIEDQIAMTETEAKERNEKLQKGSRFLRWAKKEDFETGKYARNT